MAGYSNKQLYEQNQGYIDRQDEILDDIIDEAHATGNVAKDITGITKTQNTMLDKLNSKTDNNLVKMKSLNNKLDDLIQRQSYCTLYLIITLEIACFVLMMVYL